jgi:hypothetical protein
MPWEPGDDYSAGHGSSDWNPGANELASMTPDDIASGYGLDPEEYGSYFSTFDAWKTDFAKTEYADTVTQIGADSAFKTDIYQKNVAGIDRDITEAGDAFSSTLGKNIKSISDQYADSMATMIDAQATGLVGGATGRSMRTMAARSEEGYSDAAGEASAALTSQTADFTQQKELLDLEETFRTMEGGQDDRDIKKAAEALGYTTEAEKQQYKDEIDLTLEDIANKGGFDFENYDASDWLSEITSADSHWQHGDFDKYKNDTGFLKWFYDNIDSHDRDWYRGSGEEVKTAYGHYSAGEDAGEGDDTYCCTASMRTGYMTRWKTAKLKKWHHNQSSIWRLGYDVWGKVIADHLVGKYDFAGECTEQFYQWHCNGKKSFKGAVAIIFIKPMSYIIGTYKKIKGYLSGKL